MAQRIDIRVISLKRESVRREVVASQLDSTGLQWKFFDAVDGADLGSVEGYDARRRLRLKGYELSRGEIGCFMSHKSLWERCVRHQKPCLVLEDDFLLNCDLERILDLAHDLRDEYHLLRMHGSIRRKFKVMRTVSGIHLVKFYKDPLDTAAYVISPKGAARLLEKSRVFFMTVDNYLAATWMHRIRIRALFPYPILLSEAHGSSTIRDRIETRLRVRARVLRELRRSPYSFISNVYRFWDYHIRP